MAAGGMLESNTFDGVNEVGQEAPEYACRETQVDDHRPEQIEY